MTDSLALPVYLIASCVASRPVTLKSYNDLAKRSNRGRMIFAFSRNDTDYGVVEWDNRPFSIHKLEDLEYLGQEAAGE